jgi:hypothetical protein
VVYELLEFEFYLVKEDSHSDPFTHDGEDQRLLGAWLAHLVSYSCVPRLNTKLGTFTAFPAMAQVHQLPFLGRTAAVLGKDSI